MKYYSRLLREFFKISVRTQLIYRGTFFAGVVGQWIGYGATFATLYILVSSFDLLGGWNGSEVMVLYGLSIMSYAIGASFFFNFARNLSMRIRSGEFDASLTKPLHPFLHEVFAGGWNIGYFSHFTVSLIVIILALTQLDYHITPGRFFYLVLMVFGASLIQASALIASSTMSFFTVGSNPVLDFLVYDVKEFTNYPITVFPKGIQFILTFLLPFAFINFYPASALLGKAIPEGYPALLPYFSPVVGAVLFALSILLWNWGLKNYKSTGS